MNFGRARFHSDRAISPHFEETRSTKAELLPPDPSNAIPWSFLEPSNYSWSHFVGTYRQKMIQLPKSTFDRGIYVHSLVYTSHIRSHTKPNKNVRIPNEIKRSNQTRPNQIFTHQIKPGVHDSGAARPRVMSGRLRVLSLLQPSVAAKLTDLYHEPRLSTCEKSATTRRLRVLSLLQTSFATKLTDLIAESIYDCHSVGPSIRPFCTRCYFTMTDMIQVCSNFH